MSIKYANEIQILDSLICLINKMFHIAHWPLCENHKSFLDYIYCMRWRIQYYLVSWWFAWQTCCTCLCLIVFLGMVGLQVGKPSKSKHNVLPRGSLQFKSLTKEDHGEWECVATNVATSVTASTHVQVIGKQVIGYVSKTEARCQKMWGSKLSYSACFLPIVKSHISS